MRKFTFAQQAKAAKRFLDNVHNSAVAERIQSVTQSEADFIGTPLELWRLQKTLEEINDYARRERRDSTEVMISLIADDNDEFTRMCKEYGSDTKQS